MKKLIPALCVVFFSFTAKSQWVTIPDPNFVLYLQIAYPGCMNGNQMDTTCAAIITATNLECSSANISNLDGIQYFDTLQILNCSNNTLATLPVLPKTLKQLICTGNVMTSLPILPDTLNLLMCSNNALTSLPVLPNTLTVLYCDNNLLTTLPVLPGNVNTIICQHNQLTALPALPGALTNMQCDANSLTSLPALPNSLQNLSCSFNPLYSLPALPSSLGDFNCINDSLTSLPTLPNSLYRLSCSSNQLTVLPVLPPNINTLNCGSNLLTSLPSLPLSLQQLDCSHSPLITALPALPASLFSLHCELDSITVLPTLPSTLVQLYCDFNPIAQLPALPATLRYLFADYTPITTVPALPDTMEYLYLSSTHLTSLTNLPNYVVAFDCHYNAGLHCLPELKTIGTFYWYGTGISCLPNYGTVASSNPAFDTVPLCTPGNGNGCPVFWNLAGQAYFDSISNCQLDLLDAPQGNMHVNLMQNASLLAQTFTAGSGFYSFDVNSSGIYQISVDTASLPLVLSCPSTNLYTDTITISDSLHLNRNFAFVCKPGFDLGVWSTVGAAHPARYTTIEVFAADIANFYNAHCANGVSGTVSISVTGPVSVVSASNSGSGAALISGNIATWNISDFGTLSSPYFNVTILTDTFNAMGAAVCVNTAVTPAAGDYNPANNTASYCFNVTSPYDPNVKEVYPANNIDTSQKALTYTIHFQNTGNAPAQDIHVDDTLDTELDPASFQLLAYSHQPVVQIKQNVVRFNFLNINLPDSNTNEPASHGYVQYKVKLKNNLPLGTQINNTAYIYFDFNAPVVTNTTSNTISTNTGIPQFQISNPKFQIYPNPASNAVNIVVDEGLIGSTVTVTDITGREIMKSAVQIQNSKFEIPNLTNGIYFVTIRKDGAVLSQKLVVQR